MNATQYIMLFLNFWRSELLLELFYCNGNVFLEGTFMVVVAEPINVSNPQMI